MTAMYNKGKLNIHLVRFFFLHWSEVFHADVMYCFGGEMTAMYNKGKLIIPK